MTSEDYLAALRLRWLAIVNLIALGVALAGAFTLFQPPHYRSQVSLYAVAVNRQITSSDLYNSALMAQSRVPVYAQLVQTREVLDPAIAELRLGISTRDLARQVFVTHEDEAAVLQIVAQADRPGGAKALADAIATSLIAVVEQLEKNGRDIGAVELRALSEATFPAVPTTPNRLVNLGVGFATGLVAATVVLLATSLRHFLLRRRTRSQWAYVEFDGGLKLALVHMVGTDDPGCESPRADVQTLVEPIRGTIPGGLPGASVEGGR